MRRSGDKAGALSHGVITNGTIYNKYKFSEIRVQVFAMAASTAAPPTQHTTVDKLTCLS
jgi:hypothetical protein